MIDAKRFATAYNAFWRSAAPTCDLFVRRYNLDGYERWDAPIEPRANSTRRAFIAEFGFSKFDFQKKMLDGLIDHLDENELINKAWEESVNRLKPYVNDGLDLETAFDGAERSDANEISKSLLQFFSFQNPKIITRPLFPGCGFVDTSEGDVISDDTLYEVKTVDRTLRVTDFRQLLIYSALNYSSQTYNITNVGIFNPRRGVYCKIELNELCIEVSGKPAPILLSEIIDTLISGGISR